MKTAAEAKNDFNRAMFALRVELPESIVDDVQRRIDAHLECVAKEVLKRAAENAKTKPWDDEDCYSDRIVNKDSILNTEYQDLLK